MNLRLCGPLPDRPGSPFLSCYAPTTSFGCTGARRRCPSRCSSTGKAMSLIWPTVSMPTCYAYNSKGSSKHPILLRPSDQMRRAAARSSKGRATHPALLLLASSTQVDASSGLLSNNLTLPQCPTCSSNADCQVYGCGAKTTCSGTCQ